MICIPRSCILLRRPEPFRNELRTRNCVLQCFNRSPRLMSFPNKSYCRQWRESTDPAAGSQLPVENIRIMSYNILADYLVSRHRYELYPRTPRPILDWSNRWELIFKEIEELSPDILCLQEVDHFQETPMGVCVRYKGEFLCRTGGCSDGCATFWKDSIKRMGSSRISFSESMVLKDNVALISVFKLPNRGMIPLTVANTHILFNPKRGDIKLAQVRVVCDEVFKMKKEHEGGVFICGDFNSTPNSGIYQFLHQGSIHLSDYMSKTLSGTLQGGFHRPKTAPCGLDGTTNELEAFTLAPWHPSCSESDLVVVGEEGQSREWWPKSVVNGMESEVPLCKRVSQSYDFWWALERPPHPSQRARSQRRLLDQFHFLRDWKMDHVEITMGQFLPSLCKSLDNQMSVFLIGHKLDLQSSYHEILGHEPDCTTLHSQGKTTVDYIFFTPFVKRENEKKGFCIKPICVLEAPERIGDDLLPNKEFGSDHFSLCVDFSITKTRSQSSNNLKSSISH